MIFIIPKSNSIAKYVRVVKKNCSFMRLSWAFGSKNIQTADIPMIRGHNQQSNTRTQETEIA